MDTILLLIGILAVLGIGVISPGPSFLLVARTAVAHSRRVAIASALGMATGATILAIAALLGLHAILQQAPAAYTGLKIVGGLYLLYLAVKIWLGAKAPVHLPVRPELSHARPLRHFTIAVVTMISNPKAAVQYGVIFAAMLPASPSLALTAALPLGVFLLEGSWYLIVGFVLSASGPRGTYLRSKLAIDRAAGAVMGALGLRLLVSGVSRADAL